MTIERAHDIVSNKIKCLEVQTNLFLHCNEECERCSYNHGSMNEEMDALKICRNHLERYLEDISYHTK